MRRVRHLIRKELLELKQDPRLFGIVIIAPIIQLTVLGYAATTDVKDIPLLVVDADRSAASRMLVSRFEASANFKIVAMLGSTSEIDPYLDRGEAWMALNIPPDYGRKVASAGKTTLQIVADGTDSNSTGVAMGYAQTLIGGYVPTVGTAFDVLTAPTVTGTFTTVNVPAPLLPALTYTGTSVRVSGPAALQANAWINAAGGAWSTPANWSLGRAPAQPVVGGLGGGERIEREGLLGPVVGLEQEQPEGERVEALVDEVAQHEGVPRRLGQLVAAEVQELVVHPVRHPGVEVQRALALGDLVGVVHGDVVDTAGVEVELVTQVLDRHRRAPCRASRPARLEPRANRERSFVPPTGRRSPRRVRSRRALGRLGARRGSLPQAGPAACPSCLRQPAGNPRESAH